MISGVSEAPSNVRPLQHSTEEPEQILRNALARIAEIRSREAIPYLIVLMGEQAELPMCASSPLLASDLAACGARLQIAVHDRFSEVYSI